MKENEFKVFLEVVYVADIFYKNGFGTIKECVRDSIEKIKKAAGATGQS